jgi:hypothetical protein
VDGAIAAALVRGEPRVARAAKEAARVLLAAARRKRAVHPRHRNVRRDGEG